MLHKELMVVGGGQTNKPLVNDIEIYIQSNNNITDPDWGRYFGYYGNIGKIISENKIQMSPHDNGWSYSTAKIISFYKDISKMIGYINLQVTNLQDFPQPYPFKLFIKRSSETSYIELSTNFEDVSTYDTLSFQSEEIYQVIPTSINRRETFNIILWCANWQN